MNKRRIGPCYGEPAGIICIAVSINYSGGGRDAGEVGLVRALT